MDFSKFTSEHFDAKDWINEVFRNPEAQNNKEQYASTLVMKLQLLIQEVAKSLEDTSQQIVQFIPKLNREITVMQQETNLLKSKIMSVERDVKKVEEDTCSTMDSLLLLDEAKSRMLELEKALKEVDNWTTLTKDIDEIFASGNAEIISERLFNMQQSLEVLGVKIKDYQERFDLLENLKDQFVVAVSPSIVAALTSQNAESSQYFCKMLGRLNRMKDFENYCAKVIQVELSKLSDEVLKNDDLASPDSFLDAFYDTVLSFWFDKVKWFSPLLKTPFKLVCQSLLNFLVKSETNIQSVVQHKLESCSRSVDEVSLLIRCKNSTDSLTRSLDSYLNNNLTVSSTDNSRGEKIAAAIDDAAANDVIVNCLTEFYRPYIHFVENYRNLEQSILLGQLNKINLDGTALSPFADRWSKSVDLIFTELNQALERCSLFSSSYALPYLSRAFEVLFDNYFTVLNRSFDELSSKLAAQQSSEPEIWIRLNCCLKLAETCGNLCSNFDRLKHEISSSALTLQETFSRQLTNLAKIENEKNHKLSGEYFERAVVKSDKVKNDVAKFLHDLKEAPETLMHASNRKLQELLEKVHKILCDVILEPARLVLKQVPKISTWASSNIGEALNDQLPSFSLTPQEYITKIGQYIMTLAHNLEPYLSQDNRHMKVFINNLSSVSKTIETPEDVVRYWLELTSTELGKSFVDAILNIKELSDTGCRHLVADIDYLKNVLDDISLELDEELIVITDLAAAQKVSDLFDKYSNDKVGARLFSSFQTMRYPNLLKPK